MATFKSKTVEVNADLKSVNDFLSNLNNLEKLMPEDRIQKWESTDETCSFTIKGLAGIGMKR